MNEQASRRIFMSGALPYCEFIQLQSVRSFANVAA
jgi:hypothetical protein